MVFSSLPFFRTKTKQKNRSLMMTTKKRNRPSINDSQWTIKSKHQNCLPPSQEKNDFKQPIYSRQESWCSKSQYLFWHRFQCKK